MVLLDSLNRHMLGAYGGREFETPNLDAFARRSLRFENHYAGSLPCIPARHDILCGALDFLWKPWGSIELWEDSLTAYLREAGVVTQLISDHPHLFETGGENYHTEFTAWDYLRGHESDPWRIEQLWRLISEELKFPRAVQCRVEWWNMWKRVAGGLARQQQMQLHTEVAPYLLPRLKSKLKETSSCWRPSPTAPVRPCGIS